MPEVSNQEATLQLLNRSSWKLASEHLIGLVENLGFVWLGEVYQFEGWSKYTVYVNIQYVPSREHNVLPTGTADAEYCVGK